jgi:DNA-binding MarR family transcriptional regulator
MSELLNRLDKADFEQISELRYQIRRFEWFSEQAAKEEGLTPLQYLLLLHIKGFPGRDWAHIGELAGRLLASHHAVVTLVSRCEVLGLVRRRVSKTDGRKVEVHLLDAGEAIFARLAHRHRADLASIASSYVGIWAGINHRCDG